eukprot:6491058-Amphidinium_carterae.3
MLIPSALGLTDRVPWQSGPGFSLPSRPWGSSSVQISCQRSWAMKPGCRPLLVCREDHQVRSSSKNRFA